MWKGAWGVPRASCAFSGETSFYQLLGLACFLFPGLYSHLCLSPNSHQPSYYPVVSCSSSLAPFSLSTGSAHALPSFLACISRSSLFPLGRACGNCWLFSGLSSTHARYHCSFARTLFVARLRAVPDCSDSLPCSLCFCTCRSFEKILVL